MEPRPGAQDPQSPRAAPTAAFCVGCGREIDGPTACASCGTGAAGAGFEEAFVFPPVRSLAAPPVCCCCLHPADEVRTEAILALGRTAAEVPVPWCRPCLRRSGRNLWIGFGGVVAGALLWGTLFFFVWRPSEFIWFLFLTALGALATGGAASLLAAKLGPSSRLPGHVEACAAVGEADAYLVDGGGMLAKVVWRNREFARRYRLLNGGA